MFATRDCSRGFGFRGDYRAGESCPRLCDTLSAHSSKIVGKIKIWNAGDASRDQERGTKKLSESGGFV